MNIWCCERSMGISYIGTSLDSCKTFSINGWVASVSAMPDIHWLILNLTILIWNSIWCKQYWIRKVNDTCLAAIYISSIHLGIMGNNNSKINLHTPCCCEPDSLLFLGVAIKLAPWFGAWFEWFGPNSA